MFADRTTTLPLHTICADLTAELGNGGGGALALEAELDEAREVVLDRGRASALTTNTIGRDRLGAVVDVLGDNELNLTEGTTSRHNSLTHILQQARANTVDGGEVRVTAGEAVVLEGRPGSRRERALAKRAAGARARGEGIDHILERREGHEEATISRILLDRGSNRRHFVLYLQFRNFFSAGKKSTGTRKPFQWIPLSNLSLSLSYH